MKVKVTIMLIAFSFSAILVSAQNNVEGVSIAGSVQPPDPSAMLDVVSDEKGVSIPNVVLNLSGLDNIDENQSNNPVVASPKTGLLIYNSAGDAPKGLYRFDGSRWRSVGHGDIPKMEFTDMQAMIPYLTLEDRGMFVFCTSYTANGVPQGMNSYCNSDNSFGLWYLSSVRCTPPSTQIKLIWDRILYDRGYISPEETLNCVTNQGEACPAPQE